MQQKCSKFLGQEHLLSGIVNINETLPGINRVTKRTGFLPRISMTKGIRV